MLYVAYSQTVAIDWDNTLWDTPNNRPMDGAHEALDAIHMKGWKVLIHSCNNPEYIRKMCTEHNLRVDYIWGEKGMEHGNENVPPSKPVCACFLDDRAVQFRGNLAESVKEVIEFVLRHPVKDYRGPIYREKLKSSRS